MKTAFVLALMVFGPSLLALGSPVAEHPERAFLTSVPYLFLEPSDRFEPEEVEITLYPSRSSLLKDSDRNRLIYTYALQEDPTAPLVFILPGMGGFSFNGSTLFLAETAFQQGFSVITLPSTTHWSFALAASSTGRTGYLPDDARDLYRLMNVVKLALQRKHPSLAPHKWGLMGYSYGGLDGAFVLQQDQRTHFFNFDFLLMINPPLQRSVAITKVDQYYAHGLQWTPSYRSSLLGFAMGRSYEIITGSRSIDTFKKLEEAFPLGEPALAWILAHEFRQATQSTALIGDLLDGKKTASAQNTFQDGISEYLRETVYQPKTNQLKLNLEQVESKSELIGLFQGPQTLVNGNKKIILFHSSNDFLSFPEGSLTLSQIPVEHHLYPFGGHMGLLTDETLIKDLKTSLSQLIKE